MRVHTGEKLYMCDQAFSRGTHLRTHLHESSYRGKNLTNVSNAMQLFRDTLENPHRREALGKIHYLCPGGPEIMRGGLGFFQPSTGGAWFFSNLSQGGPHIFCSTFLRYFSKSALKQVKTDSLTIKTDVQVSPKISVAGGASLNLTRRPGGGLVFFRSPAEHYPRPPPRT